ncbi:ABC-type dipeptide/oligopeptide/nickel transport system ATP-binding protein (DppD/OppD), partial [Metamycoplasma alkalescens]
MEITKKTPINQHSNRKKHKKEKASQKRGYLFSKIQAEEKLQNNRLLEVRNLHVSFPIGRKKTIHIVRGVDIDVNRAEIVGLVGESGSGKSVTSKTLINVNENALVTADKIQIGDLELSNILKKEKYW